MVDADPTHNEAKMKLAELYEILDEPRKALDLVYQGKQYGDNLLTYRANSFNLNSNRIPSKK